MIEDLPEYSKMRYLRRIRLMTILVTGGAGYIGTHTLVELINSGCSVVVVDNLSNSSVEAIKRVEKIVGCSIPLYKFDLRDQYGLEKVFTENRFDACIHFAGLKAPAESVEKPLEYYENNIGGTLSLLKTLKEHDCKNIVFSSSATVYGDTKEIPVTEKNEKGSCTNPYGWTKWMTEQILFDLQAADPVWNVVLLRYFNPIGAHSSGLIGEDPNGIPNNLLPYITQVAVGKLKELTVFGNDYPTPDGTAIRDYIHVVDLAKGHVAALKAIEQTCGMKVYNIGTGKGYSVLEVIKSFEEATGVTVSYKFGPRRPGDVPCSYSDPGKAFEELGWKAELGIKEMCRDAWNWQKNNPTGYSDDGRIKGR